MLVSSVVGVFEHVVAVLPIVICFQSLVLDMAGNVGTQSLAVTIRVLMDETLTGKQKLFLLVKEMKIGLLMVESLVLWHLHCLASTSTCLRDTPGAEHLASPAASASRFSWQW